MSIIIRIPEVKEIVRKGISVSIAPSGLSWSELTLEEHRNEVGVYVIHHDEIIKYVGKTNGIKMSFGIRLRRHFQENAAGNHTYPRLAKIETPPAIKVSLFPLSEIQKYVDHELADAEINDLISLFEATLIFAFKPEFQ